MDNETARKLADDAAFKAYEDARAIGRDAKTAKQLADRAYDAAYAIAKG